MATISRKVRTFRGGEYVAALMAELSRAAIAQRISRARKQAGLTQHELADVMHVHYRTVQDWESVRKEATPWDRLDELAAVTGVTRNWLLHGEDEEAVPDAESILRRLALLEETVARADDVQQGFQTLEAAIARLAPSRTDEAEPGGTRP